MNCKILFENWSRLAQSAGWDTRQRLGLLFEKNHDQKRLLRTDRPICNEETYLIVRHKTLINTIMRIESREEEIERDGRLFPSFNSKIDYAPKNVPQRTLVQLFA